MQCSPLPAADARSPETAASRGLSHQYYTLRRIAGLLAAPLCIMGRTFKAMGLGRLKYLQPPLPVRPYQYIQVGNKIHVYIKLLARFDWVRHRITGDRRLCRSTRADYEKVHMAIHDATRLAYAEVLTDEMQTTTPGLLIRAVALFLSQGTNCR